MIFRRERENIICNSGKIAKGNGPRKLKAEAIGMQELEKRGKGALHRLHSPTCCLRLT